MTYDHWKTTNPDDEFLGSAPQPRRRRLGYDSKCEDLADAFLSDIPTSTKEDRENLAQEIQDAIESFIQERYPEEERP